MTGEAICGAISFGLTAAGFAIGQIDPSIGGSIVGLITQFGGLGLAVWLVYQHTTVTIPNMQQEHREERKQAINDFKSSLQELTNQYTEELKIRREEFQQAITKISCKAPNRD